MIVLWSLLVGLMLLMAWYARYLIRLNRRQRQAEQERLAQARIEWPGLVSEVKTFIESCKLEEPYKQAELIALGSLIRQSERESEPLRIGSWGKIVPYDYLLEAYTKAKRAFGQDFSSLC